MPLLDGDRVVVASSRIGTVSVERRTGAVLAERPVLPSSGAVRAQGPDGELLGSAGTVIAGGQTVRSVDDELVGEGGWRLSRFAWVPGALAVRGDDVLAWELDAGKIRRAQIAARDGTITARSPDAVDGDRAIAAAFARDGRGLLVTDRAAHGFDAAGRLVFSVPLPAPEGDVRVLPTTVLLADAEAYVFLEGRILLRLPTP